MQISLLAEAQITKLVEPEIAERMSVRGAEEDDVGEMKRRVRPEAVLDAIESEGVYANGIRGIGGAGFTGVRSAVDDDGAANGGGAGACPSREIFCQFAVPRTGSFGDRALSRHPLFDRAPTVITLVRFHLSPPLRGIRPSPANG